MLNKDFVAGYDFSYTKFDNILNQNTIPNESASIGLNMEI